MRTGGETPSIYTETSKRSLAAKLAVQVSLAFFRQHSLPVRFSRCRMHYGTIPQPYINHVR